MKKRKLRQLEKELLEEESREKKNLTVKTFHQIADEDDPLTEDDLTEDARQRLYEIYEAMTEEGEDIEQ